MITQLALFHLPTKSRFKRLVRAYAPTKWKLVLQEHVIGNRRLCRGIEGIMARNDIVWPKAELMRFQIIPLKRMP